MPPLSPSCPPTAPPTRTTGGTRRMQPRTTASLCGPMLRRRRRASFTRASARASRASRRPPSCRAPSKTCGTGLAMRCP
eukprot:324855-Alexandrium_andersonii.AAC.1